MRVQFTEQETKVLKRVKRYCRKLFTFNGAVQKTAEEFSVSVKEVESILSKEANDF